jgi:hypothetical protein
LHGGLGLLQIGGFGAGFDLGLARQGRLQGLLGGGDVGVGHAAPRLAQRCRGLGHLGAGRGDFLGAGALNQPVVVGPRLGQGGLGLAHLQLQLGPVQAGQFLAGLHAHTLFDQHLGDDARHAEAQFGGTPGGDLAGGGDAGVQQGDRRRRGLPGGRGGAAGANRGRGRQDHRRPGFDRGLRRGRRGGAGAQGRRQQRNRENLLVHGTDSL